MSTHSESTRASYHPITDASEKSTGHSESRLRKAGLWSRTVPSLIIIPIAVSLSIGSLHLRDYKTSGTLYAWSFNHRSLLQAMIHVLSSLLAILWVVPLCASISHLTRQQLVRSNINLNTLRLWSAVTLARADWNLSWISALVTLGFCFVTYLPAVLWTGALSPTPANEVYDHYSLAGN
jgi:hypothetical protein